MNYPAIRQCPVCGKYRFEVEFEECPICSWMNDVTQEENPDAKGLANIMSLNECPRYRPLHLWRAGVTAVHHHYGARQVAAPQQLHHYSRCARALHERK